MDKKSKGMKNWVHNCNQLKVEKDKYKRSLHDSGLPLKQIDLIWDFYVTHALSGGSGLSISAIDYGWIKERKNNTDEKDKLKVDNDGLKKELENSANFEFGGFCIIRAKSITHTLKAMNLSDSHICISHPRAVLMRDYKVEVNENEELKYGFKELEIDAIFRHIRNAFAHGNTYFFDNGNILLEDKDGNKITASILVGKQTLLDWIFIVDKGHKYYAKDML